MNEFQSPEGFVRFSRNLPSAGQTGSLDFRLHFGRCSRAPMDFRSECVERAREIGATAREPVLLHFSGGIDSEIIARSLLEAKVPFEALSFSYASGNEHDLKWAMKFCKKHGISQRIIPLDEVTFLREEAPGLLRKMRSYDLYPAFEMKRVEMAAGFSVLGNGEPQLRCNLKTGRVYLHEYRADLILWEWQAESGRAGCLQFFRSSPELFLSYLTDPLVALWAEKAASLRMAEMSWWKYFVYKRHWPDLEKRQKWTGYERMAHLYLEAEGEFAREFPQTGDSVQIDYQEVIHDLRA